jgi:transcriptional regulator with XRE-family HTH domain
MAMDSAQIRHSNFTRLFNDFIDRRPDSPRRGMLKAFAEKLDLSDRYLSHIKCGRKNIGNSVARGIEEKLNLPHGWMDREHDVLNLPIDEREKLFVETALSLFRAQPNEARDLMLDLLRQRLQSAPRVPDPGSDRHEILAA